ncbi:hypothetical protein EII17_10375 [Clostridiales bacterium COT073_COT-073]|nr:hypothetical protein EII17_10375 [Clostridiales bacterium COT073_COT-073]
MFLEILDIVLDIIDAVFFFREKSVLLKQTDYDRKRNMGNINSAAGRKAKFKNEIWEDRKEIERNRKK